MGSADQLAPAHLKNYPRPPRLVVLALHLQQHQLVALVLALLLGPLVQYVNLHVLQVEVQQVQVILRDGRR